MSNYKRSCSPYTNGEHDVYYVSKDRSIVPAGCVWCVSGCVWMPCTAFFPIFCDKTEYVYGVYAIFLFFSFYTVYLYTRSLSYIYFIVYRDFLCTHHTQQAKNSYLALFFCVRHFHFCRTHHTHAIVIPVVIDSDLMRELPDFQRSRSAIHTLS